MSAPKKPSNQELRTRKDLLLAAGRLIKQGRKPSLEEVAKEALVSRATAYRHFGNIDTLLAEAPVDEAVGDLTLIFAGDTSQDAEARVDQAEAAMHKVTFANEAQLRIMLSHSITRGVEDGIAPKRQNRRTALIEAALATTRKRFRKGDYQKLCAALAMIFGTESMIVARDVIRIDESAARRVKSWAVRALVRAALEAGDGAT
ncbi:MAG: TetR/AcrR family transcriptional regulator [Prosthecobacter sp.]|nr:TetR/AcrR family transcriptional regulator [Prosthecobacter sp.]